MPASTEHYDIKILKDGTWLYQGTPIGRHNLVKLFASVLRREADGRFWLVTPYERGTIEVEDAPFAAVELKAEDGALSFRTNIDDWVTAGNEHPLRVEFSDSGEPSPYILVRDGLEARLTRAVYYELVKLAVPDAHQQNVFGVWSRDTFFAVGRA